MLNHMILWAYASVWKPPVTGIRLPIESLDSLRVAPECVIAERDAFEKVMDKARSGASPDAWRRAQPGGWC